MIWGSIPHTMPIHVNDSDVVEHIFVTMSQRKVRILDEAGYEEIVKYKWDDEGSEGFRETIAMFQATVTKDIITFLP